MPLDFDAIGTHWSIDAGASLSASLATRIHARIDVFDKDYSRFRADSLVTRMARRAGTYDLPVDAAPMLDLYRDLYEVTGGAFTPLIGQVLVDAGYDASYSLRTGILVTPPSWDEAIDYAFPRLRMKQPALLDFGGIGKGYLVDIAAEMLEGAGITAYTVDAGGDMRHRGAALRVGLEDPRDTTQAIGVATLDGGSLCGSAGNRRAWGVYHHIIDPRTLTSPRHLLAVWTTAETTLLADAMAGCLYFVDAERLAAYTFEYALLRADGTVDHSHGFPATFFTERS